MNTLSVRTLFAAVIGMCLVAAGFYVMVWRDAPYSNPDTRSYLEVADDLRDGGLDRLSIRTVGYPLFLLVVQMGRGLFFSQLALHLIAVVCGAALLYWLRIPVWVVSLFALTALLPPYAENAAFILTEALAGFVVAVAMCALVVYLADGKVGWLILASVMLAFLPLVRPAFQLLPLVLGVMLLVMRQRHAKQAAAALIAACLLCQAGMRLYNGQTFGYSGFSIGTGASLASKIGPYLERLPDEHATARDVLIEYRDRELLISHNAQAAGAYIWQAHRALREATGLSGVALDSYLMDLSLSVIRDAPLGYLAEVLYAIPNFWLPTTREPAHFGSVIWQAAWAGLHFAISGVFGVGVMLLAGAGFMLMSLSPSAQQVVLGDDHSTYSLRAALVILSVTTIGYTMLVSSALNVGEARYRSPVDLLILLTVVVSLHTLWDLKTRFASLSIESA